MAIRSHFACAAVAIAVAGLTAVGTCAEAASPQSLIKPVQFDDTDGVAGCVNQCKLDLEICLGTRPDGESPDRCEQLEDQCEDKCYSNPN